MGIDKPNIRWVVHYNLPKNIENYYQEIGRSGRDGKRADTLMFYSFGDVRVYRDFIEKSDANEEFKRVQYEKLDRIWDYSQATNCRTNVILNYFGEYRETPCGHCDHCLNPLRGFDGTRLAQMALSACKRCEESIGMGMLADVLRGSARKEIFEKKLHLIKTYGAGRDYSYTDWMAYLTQLINQGLLEIDYTQHSVLKCTPLSDAVLFGSKKVTLHQPVEAPLEPVALRQPKHVQFGEGLMEKLDALCEQISHEEGMPREAVFSKKILSDIVFHRPVTKEDFMEIEGMEDYKSRKYSDVFLDTIRNYMTEQKIIKKPRGVTYIETLNLYRKGMTPIQIAQERGMAEATIASHLAKLYEKGEDIDLQKYVTATDLTMARQAWRASGYSEQIGKIKEEVGDSLDYAKLHMAVAILRKEKLNE
jgi:ATP-dependent DNA helicase RecQ